MAGPKLEAPTLRRQHESHARDLGFADEAHELPDRERRVLDGLREARREHDAEVVVALHVQVRDPVPHRVVPNLAP